MANNWGGARAGAGRKTDGKERRATSWKISEDEKAYLRNCLNGYRTKEQDKPESVENFAKIAFLAYKDGKVDVVAFATDKAGLVNKLAQNDEKLSFYVSTAIKQAEENAEKMKAIFTRHKNWDDTDKVDSAYNAVVDYFQRDRYCDVWAYEGESTKIKNITCGDFIVTADGRYISVYTVEPYGDKVIIHGSDKIGTMAKILPADTLCFKIEGKFF